MTARAGIDYQRRQQRQATERRVRSGTYTTSDIEFAGLSESLRRQRDLSDERAKQNAFLKALRLGKFGQRSLLSGSFAGITDETSAASALGGTRPGSSVAAASGGGAGQSIGGGSGSSTRSGGVSPNRRRSMMQ